MRTRLDKVHRQSKQQSTLAEERILHGDPNEDRPGYQCSPSTSSPLGSSWYSSTLAETPLLGPDPAPEGEENGGHSTWPQAKSQYPFANPSTADMLRGPVTPFQVVHQVCTHTHTLTPVPSLEQLIRYSDHFRSIRKNLRKHRPVRRKEEHPSNMPIPNPDQDLDPLKLNS